MMNLSKLQTIPTSLSVAILMNSFASSIFSTSKTEFKAHKV